MKSNQISGTTPTAKLENDRQVADFDPCIWGDLFLSFASNTVKIEDETNRKNFKVKVRRMIILGTDNPEQHLDLIDAIHRLGVFYHFEKEIDEFMHKLHEISIHRFDGHVNNDDYEDLHVISLLFRLLRQHGYKVSSDVFNKFKDAKGNFNESLATDVQGMLSLYEATKLRVHGEDILEQALVFATTRLTSIASNSSPNSLVIQIKHALNHSIQRNMPRHETKHFISVYEEDPSYHKDLLTFAKLDFNILQIMHQKEVNDIQRWYKSLVAPKNLSFARSRVVECYLFTLGVYFEPEYALGRELITKLFILISILDDIYDSFGKYEELVPFTEALERWDINAASQLPEYMKHCYELVLDLFEEIEKLMVAEGKAYRVPYAIEEMKNLVRAYAKEAKWFNENYVPTVEEYMKNGVVSSAYVIALTIGFIAMGDVATKQVFEWVTNTPTPKLIKACGLIGRLTNDITSNEFEQKRGHVASAIECYMKQYAIGRQEAVNEVRKQLENEWKDINEDCLYPTASFPMPILLRPLNLSRVSDLIYGENDGYTFPKVTLKDVITSLLLNPIPL